MGLRIGIDRNVGQIALSTGDIIPLPDTTRLEARRKRYQRMIARRKKGSNRRKRAVQLARRTSRAIADVRKDWCHQTSRMLADAASESRDRGLEHEGHDGERERNNGTARNERRAESGPEPGDSWSRDGAISWNRTLGHRAFELTKVPARAHFTGLQCLWLDRHIQSQNTERISAVWAADTKANADINAALNILASGIGASGRRGVLALATPLNRQKAA